VANLIDLSIFIISVKNSRNHDALKEDVSQQFKTNPITSWGVTPKELPCSGNIPHLHEGKIRPLSCHEVAAALSHSRARELAFAEGSEWSMFLEDDSELIHSENSDVLSNLFALPENVPFFVHFFPEQNGILTSSRYHGLNTIRKIPDYANAYAMNREALKLFLQNTNMSHLYLADWPKFSRRINRIATSRSVFRHPSHSTASSLISDERQLIQARSRAFSFRYQIQQVVFRTLRMAFAKFGSEKIANENLRSIKWF